MLVARYNNTGRIEVRLLFLVLFFFINSVWAIDNPDATDYVSGFKARILPLEKFIRNDATSMSDYSSGYGKLNSALDKELNQAYRKAMTALSASHRKMLRTSQRQWIKYRDAELKFINSYYTRARFGSSFLLDRGNATVSIVKMRIIPLLRYL